jgi:hypothetical protein
VRKFVIAFLLLLIMPISLSAARYVAVSFAVLASGTGNDASSSREVLHGDENKIGM